MARGGAGKRGSSDDQPIYDEFGGLLKEMGELIAISRIGQDRINLFGDDYAAVQNKFKDIAEELGYEGVNSPVQPEDTQDFFKAVRPLYPTDNGWTERGPLTAADTARYEKLDEHVKAIVESVVADDGTRERVKNGSLGSKEIFDAALKRFYQEEAAQAEELEATVVESEVNVEALAAAHTTLVSKITDGDIVGGKKVHNDSEAVREYLTAVKAHGTPEMKEAATKVLQAHLDALEAGVNEADFFVTSGASKQIKSLSESFGKIEGTDVEKIAMLSQITVKALGNDSEGKIWKQDVADKSDDSHDKDESIEKMLAEAKVSLETLQQNGVAAAAATTTPSTPATSAGTPVAANTPAPKGP